MTRQPESRFPDIGGGVAIIAGSGVLPRLLAEECRRNRSRHCVVVFEGSAHEWTSRHQVIRASSEKLGQLFDDIRDSGCTSVTFAGGMVRPRLDTTRIDAADAKLVADMQAALARGDGETLRFFTGLFEAQGLRVIAPQEFLPGLVEERAVLTVLSPSPADKKDAARAAEIVRALGEVDVGQAAVVAQGICLAVESIPGTDTMLAFVASNRSGTGPDPDGARGVLLKAPKPGQDRRVDLPTIGPQTMRAAAEAGLAGVVIEAGGVLLLERDETIAEADRLGLFLWSRKGTTG